MRQLFERVADLTPEQRAAELRAAGATADELSALSALFEADRQQRTIFDTPAADWAKALDCDPSEIDAMIGQQIGPYRILTQLGMGGSSIVFRAARIIGDAEQTVALKLLHHGLFSSEARRRFRREQSILAHLVHPNIARLIDGGVTEAGIPYIALELIDGLDLITYANAHTLARDRRLRLLEDLCRTVDAAHRALIVHRDLKPSNVLVTAEGHIRVLDFGIAKLLDDDQPATATQHIALTPGYAAPEQYQHGPTTTAADVYALGVLASELLLGFRLGPDATRQHHGIDDRATRRRWRKLDAELVDILRAALASEPARRYSSAGHMADDISRYLRNEPITVSAPSQWYRMRKFVTRHRGGVGVTLLLSVAITVGFAVALWQANVAHRELERANAMRDFMFDLFSDAEPSVPRAAPSSVVDAVERGIANARSDRTVSPQVRFELLTRLASVLDAQGKLPQSQELLQWVVASTTSLLGPEDDVTADAFHASARNSTLRGDFDGARQTLDHLLATAPQERRDRRVRLLLDSATLATKQYDLARARREDGEAIALARRLDDPELMRLALDAHAAISIAVGDREEAIAAYTELLSALRNRFGEEHVLIASAQAGLSRALLSRGDVSRAEASARAALAIDRKVYPADDWHTASHLNALAMVLKVKRDYRSALEAELEDLRISRMTLGEKHPDIALTLNNIGALHFLLEEFANAGAPLRESLELTTAQFGPEHWSAARVRQNYGYALAKSGATAAGIAEIDHAIASIMALADPDYDLVATILEKRVRIALDRGEAAAALGDIERLAEAVSRIDNPDPYWDGRVQVLRGNALLDQHRSVEAANVLDQARTTLAQSRRADPVMMVESLLLAAEAAQARGDAPKAVELRDRGRQQLATLRNPPRRLTRLAGVDQSP